MVRQSADDVSADFEVTSAFIIMRNTIGGKCVMAWLHTGSGKFSNALLEILANISESWELVSYKKDSMR